MMDFVPFMILAAVVLLVVAGLGARRSGLVGRGGIADMEPLPEAEAELDECLRRRGFDPPPFRVYRDPADGELVIVGPETLPADLAAALAACDRGLSARHTRPR